jgi:fibronectin-binding autotransporter adhesin
MLPLILTLPLLLAAPAAFATSATWSGATSGLWSDVNNWTGIPATPPGTGEAATFNAASANTTINLTGGVTVASNLFDTVNAAAYTIGSGGVGAQTLTLSAPGAIRISSTVTNSQLFNASLSLGTAAGNKTFLITNASTSAPLILAGGLSTAQTGNITNTFAGAGSVIINGPILNGSGSVVLLKPNNPGSVVLTTSNSLTGVLFNTGANSGDCGVIRVAHSDALTGATITMNGQNATTQTIELTNNITLANNINSNSRDAGRPMIRSVSGTNTYAGTYIATATGGGITFEANNGKLNMTGGLITTNAISARGIQYQGTGLGETAYSLSSLFVGTVTKTGSGTWTLSVSNSHAAGTTINGGTLNVTHPSALGTGLITMAGTSNATLNFATDGGDYTNALNAGSSTTWTLSSDVKTGSVGITHTLGTVTIGSGTPALQMNIVRGPNVLSGSPRISFNSFSLTAGVGGTTIINPTTADITLPDVTPTATSKTLQLDGTSTGNEVTGAIVDNGAFVITLVKTNVSTWTLNGASTYSGKTTVGQGILALTGTASLASTNLFVGAAGVLDVSGLSGGSLMLNFGQTLSGNGTVKGTVDCSSGAIAPGASAGTLTVSNLTLGGSGYLNYELANVTTIGGGTNDYLVVPGTLTISGFTTLNAILLNGSPASTGKYTLISYGAYSGPSDISGNFSIPAGFVITNNPTTKAIELVPTHVPINILWVGGSGSSWDFTTPNWNSPDNLFYSGDSPRFDDSATTTGPIFVSVPVGCGLLTVSNSVAYGFSGSSISAGAFVKQGSGTLTIENDVAVGGGTLISGGTLQIGNGGTTGTLTTTVLTNNAALIANRTDFALVITNPITGSGTFTQAGSGSTELVASNSYTGATLVSAGRINVSSSSSLGTANSGTVVDNSAALYVIANVDIANESLQLNGSGLASDGSGALRKGGAGPTTWSGPITLGSDSTIGVDSGATLTLSNAINGSSFALTKTGDGTLTLVSNNTLNGVTLSAGTLNINAAQALGQTPGVVTITGGTIDNTSGTPLTLTQNQDMVWGGSFAFGGATNLHLGNGVVTMDANRTLTLNNSMLTVGGTINGAGRLTAEGAGILSLTASNAFTGGLLLDDGPQNVAVVRLANSDAAGTGVIAYNGGGNSTAGRLELIGNITVTNAISLSGRNVDATAIQNISGNNVLSGTVSVFGGGSSYLFQSDSGTLTFSGATGDGIAMTVLAGNRVFTLRGAGDGVVSGIISNGVGTAGVAKSGTGTWTLSAANPYTGPTTVNGGTLLVNGSLDAGSAVAVVGGTLSGNGTIGGTVTVNSGGTLAPGTSVGTLTVGGTLTLNSGSTNTFEVNGSTLAKDEVVLGSAVAYGGVLNIVPSGTFTVGQTFTLFSGAGAISGFNFDSIQGSAGSGKAFAFTNGVLSVISGGAPSPVLLTNSVTGGGTMLSLAWPAGQGWRLQQQITNRSVGLSTNWVFITDSSVSSTNIAIDKANGTVFYRLVYP